MALGENEGMNTTMLVSPTGSYAYPYNNGGIGGMGLGSDWGSLIILFLLFGMFGNGGFGGGFGGYGNSQRSLSQAGTRKRAKRPRKR